MDYYPHFSGNQSVYIRYVKRITMASTQQLPDHISLKIKKLLQKQLD